MKLLWIIALSLAAAACAAERPAGADEDENNGQPTNNGQPDNNGSQNNGQEPAQTVRIATWNVRFFYDDVCDTGLCGDDTREPLPSTEEFEARADEIAAAIERVDADVILLQEVETQACLDAVRARLDDDRYQVWVLGEIRQAGSIDTAVIARSERDPRVVKHRQDPFVREDGETAQFLRELLEVHLTLHGQEVIVFTAHFRSRLNDDPAQRHAEAARTREVVDEVAQDNPDALIVLGGDLNDTPGSQTLETLEGDGGLIRVAAELAPNDWTINSRGNLSALDHLYLAPGRGAYVPGSAEIIRDGNALGGSDHAALAAEFVPPGLE